MPRGVSALCCAVAAQLGLVAAVSHASRHKPSAVDFFKSQQQYAYVKFSSGELVEGKARDGSWVKCTVLGRAAAPNSYNVQVNDPAGPFSLPAVPSQMLRRLLGPGERDFYVDNSLLNHSGAGVKYRYKKWMDAKMDDYAPWGTLISGTDEHDGWVRLNLLTGIYIPTSIQGVRVLTPAGRDHAPPPSAAQIAARAASKESLGIPDYAPGDSVDFKTQAGQWFPARIVGAGEAQGSYRIMVMPTESTALPINNVEAPSLRKRRVEAVIPVPTAPPRRTEQPAPACQSGGCVALQVKTSKGRSFELHISKKSRVEMLMKMVCNKLKITWDLCQAQTRFTFQDQELSPWTHVDTTGLEDNSVVSMEELPPPEQSPVDDLLLAQSKE